MAATIPLYHKSITLVGAFGEANFGQPVIGANVQLAKNAVFYSLANASGTNVYQTEKSIPAGRYALYVNSSLVPGASVEVGAGESDGIGYDDGKLLKSTATGRAFSDGSEFVPYTGATGNVNLGTFNLSTTGKISAGLAEADAHVVTRIYGDGRYGRKAEVNSWTAANTWTAAGNIFNHPLGVANATADGHAINLGQANGLYASRVQTSHAIYVSKEGNDANDGRSLDKAKLTIGSAITAAGALITGGATGVRIDVMDGGAYAGGFTVPDKVVVFAVGASVSGSVSIFAGGELFVDRHTSSANNQSLLEMGGASDGGAVYCANFMDGRGHTGVTLVRNVGGGGKILFTKIAIAHVGADGIGYGGGTGGFGHTHIETQDLYLSGNNAVGIDAGNVGANAANMVGIVHRILKLSGTTGTTAIRVTNANAVAKLVCSEISADTAYNVSAGALYLSCPFIVGTHTGNARIITDKEVQTDLVRSAYIQAQSSSGVHIRNSSGNDVLLLGAGPGLGSTFYGQVNGTALVLSGNATVANATLSGHAVNLGQANSLYVAQNAAITGATKTKITYDAKGLVTAGADLTASDIPTLDASKITSGTLGVARGGTGATSFTSGNVLVGAGTSAVTTLSRLGIDTRTIFPTDATTHNHDSVYGRLASANTWQQAQTFNQNPVKGASATESFHLISRWDGDDRYACFAFNNRYAGTNYFNGSATRNTRTSIHAQGADTRFELGFWKGPDANVTDTIVGELGLTYNTSGSVDPALITSERNAAIRWHRGSSTTGGYITVTAEDNTEILSLKKTRLTVSQPTSFTNTTGIALLVSQRAGIMMNIGDSTAGGMSVSDRGVTSGNGWLFGGIGLTPQVVAHNANTTVTKNIAFLYHTTALTANHIVTLPANEEAGRMIVATAGNLGTGSSMIVRPAGAGVFKGTSQDNNQTEIALVSNPIVGLLRSVVLISDGAGNWIVVSRQLH